MAPGTPIFCIVQGRLRGASGVIGWQQARVLLVGVLGFNRQPVPHSCHVDQNGFNSRIRRAVRHLPAFNGMLSLHSTGVIIAALQDAWCASVRVPFVGLNNGGALHGVPLWIASLH
jgi:hypothetical protein